MKVGHDAAIPMTVAEMVRDFHCAFGLPVRDAPVTKVPTLKSRSLRAGLADQEHDELLDEIEAPVDQFDLAKVAQELADVVYVAYGTAVEWGIPLDDVIAAVHESNMSKLWPCKACGGNGWMCGTDPTSQCRTCHGKRTEPRYHDGSHAQPKGKVKKPPTYRPPDVRSILGG